MSTIIGLIIITAPCALTAWLTAIGVHPALATLVGVVLLLAIGKGMSGGPS